MKCKGMSMLYVGVFLMICATVIAVPVQDQNGIQKLARASNNFAMDLFQQLPKDENLFISPFSISTAMGMVYLGAREGTARELEATLGYQEEQLLDEEVHQAFQSTLNQIEGSQDQYKLIAANSMVNHIDYSVLDSYKTQLQEKYKAEIREADFVNEREKATQEINEWVDQKTQHKIAKLFEEPLSSDTILVLLNAVYFKGTWLYKFNSSNTLSGTFYNKGTDGKDILFMHLTHKFNFTEVADLQARMIELPYKGKDISMFAILPYQRNGLAVLESQLNPDKITKIIGQMRETRVSVDLPKFDLTYEKELSPFLQSLGLTKLFKSGQSDLSGISSKNDLSVSKIKHKAVIEVNEEGSEAAAATGVLVFGTSLGPTFYADHPFLFIIRDNISGMILFLGRVNEF
ncbi:serpin B3-like isoform X2 [Limulus polyphemus]|uniref:Serpin B3-like isoform X2 n=1 Tax=Limulus polyphemus TaxID=6850 RepID=A0ABM1TGY5_LIMPO|nr:serpin B3-like isoform X2 [Limulus polyphemus]